MCDIYELMNSGLIQNFLVFSHDPDLTNECGGPFGDRLNCALIWSTDMRLTTTLAAAAALAVSGFAANAGGMDEPVMAEPVMMPEPVVEPAGSSISPTWVIVGVLVALVAAAAANQ